MMLPAVALGLLLCVQLCGGTGELRLVGGGGRCAGRVEMKHEGEWGSVCQYDFWNDLWAKVVCRQLGCGRVLRSSPYAPFGRGTGRIWMHPFCLGNEMELQQCPHSGWGQPFCGHENDVGVTCAGADAVELRLVGGGSPCARRVEAKLQGRWGVVASNKWNMEEAEVVCQQLGCGSATSAYIGSTLFGVGDGPISLAGVTCHGHEATIWDCEIAGWGPYSGPHDYDTTVICQGFARLVGGDSSCSGWLEVRQNRMWTRVCEDGVDIQAAQVVCRELGCGMALAVTSSSQLEMGQGPFWEGGFKCNGTEPLLSACARRPPGSQGCTGRASIVCSPYTGFRLANHSSRCAGRVEVEAGGTWGSLCATGWDLPDAHVLCHHLGCGAAVAVPPGGSFGEGKGPLRRDAFGCGGSERHPGECPVAVLGQPACPPGHTAAVNCSGAAEPLRLVEGESRCDGRLEVTRSPGTWARVPVGLRDLPDGSEVCGQLGCGEPEKVFAVPGSGAEGLLCAGTENLTQCNVSGTASAPTGSAEEVAVVCSGSRRVRLAGGPGRCAGRVEVYVNGTWSSVCQEPWDMADTAVVCRQLGCGTALAAPGSTRFGPGTGPLWLDAGGCAGTEASLWDCPALAPGGCPRGGGAGAVCSEQLSLRLWGGRGRCSGHLEVFYNGTWGRVCTSGTSHGTAAAVCRWLGCGHGGSLWGTSTQPPAPAWLEWVTCEEGARALWQCSSAPWHLQACSPDGDVVHITCNKDSDDTSSTPTPSPDVGSSTNPVAPVGMVSVPTVLCVVLGTLLCLALGALALQACRARRRAPGRAAATAEAIYEELAYPLTPEYQEVPSRSGSPSQGSGTNLPYYSGDSVEESDPEAAPEPPAHHDPPDGYDDAAAVMEESPAAGAGDMSQEVAQRSWGSGPPTGGSCPPPDSPGARGDPLAQLPGDTDPLAQLPGDTDYDDVGSSTLGSSL